MGVPVRGRANNTRSKLAKSEATRQRLCEATEALLEQKPLRLLKVTDITVAASVSPATFYVYFADVEEAVLAVLDAIQTDMPDFGQYLANVGPDRLESSIRAMVVAYLSFSERHYAVLRVRNLAADEGQIKFREARRKMLHGLQDSLQAKIEERRGHTVGKDKAPAAAITIVLMGALERLAAFARTQLGGRDITRRKLIDATVVVISATLRGEM